MKIGIIWLMASKITSHTFLRPFGISAKSHFIGKYKNKLIILHQINLKDSFVTVKKARNPSDAISDSENKLLVEKLLVLVKSIHILIFRL